MTACAYLPYAATRCRVPSGRAKLHTPGRVKAALGGVEVGRGALVLALTRPGTIASPAREAVLHLHLPFNFSNVMNINGGHRPRDPPLRHFGYDGRRQLSCTSGEPSTSHPT